MELNEYQKQAMTTCMVSCENDTYILFGLMAEVGEPTRLPSGNEKGLSGY